MFRRYASFMIVSVLALAAWTLRAQEPTAEESVPCIPEPIETPVEVFADAFIGVERKPLRIADALEKRIQRDRFGAHGADVFFVDQPPVQRPKLAG